MMLGLGLGCMSLVRALGAEIGIEVGGYGLDSSMLDTCARTLESVF